jgi:hypothetical protein
MSAPFPATVARRIRMTVFVLVAILSVVPGLVRATKPLRELTPAPFRLSRGFELPPTKCSLTPPSEVAVPAVSLEEPQPQPVNPQTVELNEALPDSALNISPEDLRGPPSPLLA